MILEMTQMLLVDVLPAEVLAAALLFCLPLRRRRFFPLRAAGTALLLMALPFVLPLGMLSELLQGDSARLAYTLLYSLLSYLIGAAFVLACCAVSVREALYCATCAYLTQHFTYCLHRFLRPGMDTAAAETYDVWYLLIYGAAYALAYVLFARRLVAGKRYDIRLSHSLGTMAGALSVALVLSAVAQHLESRGGSLYPVCLLYAMFCCFYVLWAQVGQCRRLALQHELDVQQQLWLKHKDQFEMTAENVELINRKCHDLKHQIAALKQISDQSQRDATIRSLEEACLSFLEAVDLYTLFGNALDNAIEHVSALEDVERRTIAVSVFSRADLVFIQLENYYSGPLEFDDGLPISRKARDGYHGFGLKSVRHTAERYGGFLTLQTEGDIFLLRVTIPRYREC